MQNWRTRVWPLATMAAVAVGASRTSLAQSASSATADSAPSIMLQTVVVTAERRKESLQKTPAAVTAISSEALAEGNIATTEDLMQVVPSLQVATQSAADGSGSATFFLRGMGQQRSGNGSEPAVGVYVDGFYYPSLEGDIFDIVDLENVQVLRGPQGTLFGRNTIGGAILYTTRQPELGSFAAHVTGTYGSYNRADFTGVINIPVGDTLALRLTAGHLARDGYVKLQSGAPDAGGTDTNLARLQLKFAPSEHLSDDFSAMWDRSQLNGFAYDLPGPLTPVPGPTLPYIYNTLIAPALHLPLYTNALESACFYCQPGPSGAEFSTTDYENALNTVTWNAAPSLSVKSLTGWQHFDTHSAFDLDGTPLPIFYGGVTKQEESVFSQEFQFSGDTFDRRLNYVSGLFYYQDHLPLLQQVSPGEILAAPGGALTTPDQTTRSYAAYADLRYKLTPKLTLIGGYRYSVDDITVITPVQGVGILKESKRFPSNTWRAGAQYQWNSDVMTYFTVSTGFRAGGFNPYQAAANGVVPFEPEKVQSYEVGTRLQFLDQRLTLNPTAFYYDWNKIQVQSVYFAPGSTVGAVVLQNAGAAVGKGFELEWGYLVAPGLRIFGNLATLDLHYTSIGDATGITLTSPLERAPKLTYSVGVSDTHELGSEGDITTSLNYSYEGQQNSTPTNADALILPAYSLLNTRVEWDSPDQRYSIALFGTNLTNRHYYIGGVNYYANVGAAHYDLGQPREFGVTMSANF